MKLIAMTLLIGMMTGAADAADIFDLHRFGASEAAARAAAGQVPQVPPVFPPAPGNNNWPGAFPQPPHGSIDTCVFTGFSGGKCWFKCASGDVIAEPPVKIGTPRAPADVCATHVFLTVPAAGRKGGRTMGEDWKSVALLASDGTQLSVDYVAADLGGKVNATRIWITASNPKFTGTEKISARLSNYYEAKPGSPESLKEASTQLLSFNGGSFQALAKFPDISLFEAFHSWQNDFHQSLTVTVNGTNLQTGSGMNQFIFKMPGKPAWAGEDSKAAKLPGGCLFSGSRGDTCVYKCEGGKEYTRPMNRPSPFGDESIVPCPAFFIQF